VSRVWITCALVTAAVVAIIVVVTSRRDAEANGDDPKLPRAPAPLSEQEIRTYLDVMPGIKDGLGRIAVQLQTERVRGTVDEKAFQIKSQALVDSILERNHLTRDSWFQLSERVEYVVNARRASEELEKARPELEEKLRLKRAALESLAHDRRADVEKEIADLERLLDSTGPPLSQRDKELVNQFWATLSELVPRRGSPK